MQPAAASHADPFTAATQGQLQQEPQAAAAAALPLPAQHGVASWQIAYLEQAMQQQQQPTDIQAAMPAQQQQQQQTMYQAAGFPEAANMLPAYYHPALLHQHTQQQQFQSDLWAAAGDGAAGHASTQLPLQHAGRSGPRASASSGRDSGSAAKKTKGDRAPTAAATTTTTPTKKPAAGGSRKPRKVTDAQRAAHKRFRMRRKEQVGGCVWCVGSCSVPFVPDWIMVWLLALHVAHRSNRTVCWDVALRILRRTPCSSSSSSNPGRRAGTQCKRTLLPNRPNHLCLIPLCSPNAYATSPPCMCRITRMHVPHHPNACAITPSCVCFRPQHIASTPPKHLLRRPQVSSLAAEVAAKQEQLAALEAEREALTAKARALDQLVASAGVCAGEIVSVTGMCAVWF